MGYTNSKEVYNLFNNKIIYDSNIKKLFHKAIEYDRMTIILTKFGI